MPLINEIETTNLFVEYTMTFSGNLYVQAVNAEAAKKQLEDLLCDLELGRIIENSNDITNIEIDIDEVSEAVE